MTFLLKKITDYENSQHVGGRDLLQLGGKRDFWEGVVGEKGKRKRPISSPQGERKLGRKSNSTQEKEIPKAPPWHEVGLHSRVCTEKKKL